MEFPRKNPSLYQRILIFLTRLIPSHRLGTALSVVNLILYRTVLQSLNLYQVPSGHNPPLSDEPDYRKPDASGNDTRHYYAGAANTPFGRNMPPAQQSNPLRDPPVQLVAQRLLHRTTFKPAGMQLNILAAAWIQAMTHDWFGHIPGDDTVSLDKGTPQCPLKAFQFKSTKQRPDGLFDNFRTHWWDASFVYGQDEAAVMRARTFDKGKLHMSNVKGRLARDPTDGTNLVGDAMNSWVGVTVLQEIFVREHNMICDAIADAHPQLANNDELLFRKARLVVAALVAKVHTVDWTLELLKTDTLRIGMNTNWYGLPKALGLTSNGPPGLFSLVAIDKAENHGVPYNLTEEFVAVYRLHPMLPDGIPLSSGFVPLEGLVGLDGEKVLYTSEDKPREVWEALVQFPCGNLELYNYPRALRQVCPTNERGIAQPHPVDLAALDLYRDRERNVRNYNSFRRELYLKPFGSYIEMCGDQKTAATLEELYGKDGIENVDLLVGLLAERKIPGFAISETAFLIFLVMASRRLEADRFFTSDFNEGTYTSAGFRWVNETSGMRDVLRRHFPEVDRNIKEGDSAFKPQVGWDSYRSPTHYESV